jgi:hypothetical protein
MMVIRKCRLSGCDFKDHCDSTGSISSIARKTHPKSSLLSLHPRNTLRRQVVRVSGRRPHSRLPQSACAKNRVNETAVADQKQMPASVGWRTDTRAACPTHTPN